MSESDPIEPPQDDEILFACIGCGTMNRVGTDLCAGCRHAFGGPDVTTPPRPAPPVRPTNPYEPPAQPLRRPGTLQISTVMALIAIIAVCLAGFGSDTGVGAMIAFSLIPATIRTLFVMRRRAVQGRPMTMRSKVQTFLMTIVGGYLVVCSSMIAFGVTCFPLAFGIASLAQGGNGDGMMGGVIIAIGSGVVMAIVTAVFMTKALLRLGRNWRDDEGESIRWR